MFWPKRVFSAKRAMRSGVSFFIVWIYCLKMKIAAKVGQMRAKGGAIR